MSANLFIYLLRFRRRGKGIKVMEFIKFMKFSLEVQNDRLNKKWHGVISDVTKIL